MPYNQEDNVSVLSRPRMATVWHGVGTMYSMLTTSIALSTTLYFAVSKDTPSHTQFHEIFFCILYLLALVAMIFVLWVSREQEEPPHSDANGKTEAPTVATVEWPTAKPKVLSEPTPAEEEEEEEEEEGFNVYLRIGLVMFLVGLVTLNVIRLVSHAMHAADGCFRPWRVAVNSFELLFAVLQVALLLLRHRSPMGLHLAPLCRVALAHLFTANLCCWFYSIVGEIKEHVLHLSHSSSNASHSSSNASHGSTAGGGGHETAEGADCSGALLDAVNPFLSPTVIEFCLLAAAMSLKLLLSVDCRVAAKKLQHQRLHSHKHRQHHKHKLLRRLQWEKAKDAARRVLFSELLASRVPLIFSAFCVIVAVVGTILLYTAPVDDQAKAGIYLGQELLLCGCGSVLAVLASVGTVKLSFARVEKHSFDHSLLLFAQFGTIAYQIVMFSTLIDHFDTLPRLLNVFDIMTLLVSMLQQMLQTHCLLDGLRRKVSDRHQAKEAPGRTAYLALLGVNLALWIAETFEVRKTEEILLDYTLHEVWATAIRIIVHVGQPFSIFYRFHSTVCLSVIWSRAYQAKEESFVDLKPPLGADSVS